MLEAASSQELQRPEHPLPYRCQHCGKDRRDQRYSWRNGLGLVFGCCPQMLQEAHGADPAKVVAQCTDRSLFGGMVKPEQQAALLISPR